MASRWVELDSAEDVLTLADMVHMFHQGYLFAKYTDFIVSEEWLDSDWLARDKANGWTYRVLVEEDD